MPQEKLLSYIAALGNDIKPNETPGLDCSVVRTRHGLVRARDAKCVWYLVFGMWYLMHLIWFCL